MGYEPIAVSSCVSGDRRPTCKVQLSIRLQLTSREPEQFTDLATSQKQLKAAGVAHGDMVYLLYDFVRQVEPAYKKTPLEARPFGERAPEAQRDVVLPCLSRAGQ